ncbi:hypothetical protein L1987_38604 [Smallanthus sonchifolius]|uniref:Uncharacterized protein n=1 Tax=Smallanthus sonchifolius TaxID=185202 RepID=A0ACB9HKJ8_9ASTR|nr:hypothetical protein L1987_38604 [Smallanthus sonchifolius]
MADAGGFHRFPLPLDPTAQEFRPVTYVYYSFHPPPVPAFIIPALPPSSLVPTRALLLSYVPTNVSESTVRRELEVFGDVRAVQMERLRDGIVTVHFYDLRQATEALNKIQEQHMQQQRRLRQHFHALTLAAPPPLPQPARGLLCGRVIWAQFAFPLAAGLPDRYNQGTVIITSDSNLSIGDVRDAFEGLGVVKEIRETPLKRNQIFVEFYDTRDATKAVAAVNGQEINGKQLVVEFGGHKLIPNSPPPLPVREDVVRNGSHCAGGLKKNVKHRQSPERWVSGRNKPWKGHRYNREKCDPRFSIKGDAAVVSSFQDSRTTVMIKNIPNKYRNKCNVGYGFVNMTSPEATWRLYKAFNHQNWEVFNSKKICQVSYARLQGLEALKEHFKNSKFPCEVEDYMPVVFTPPRDGRTVTEPIPIVGGMTSSVEVGCHDLTDGRSSHNNLLVEDTRSDATTGSSSIAGGED